MLNWYKIAKKYQIGDNGGTPFKADIKGNKVYLYQLQKDENGKPDYKNKNYIFFKEYKFQKAFVEEDQQLRSNKKCKNQNGKTQTRSLLFKLNTNKYLFVGCNIYQFITNDQITKFYNAKDCMDDVGYQVAESNNMIYFLWTHKMVQKNKFNKYKNKKDAFQQFYCHKKPCIKENDKLDMNVKIIKKRNI